MKSKHLIFLFIIVFSSIIFFFIQSPVIFELCGIDCKHRSISDLLTALFSALAFGALIITLYHQSKELSLNLQEQKNAVNEFANQNRNINLQRIDNTFFELLGNYRSDINKLSFKYENNQYTSVTVLRLVYELFKNNYDKLKNERTVSMHQSNFLDDEKMMKDALSGNIDTDNGLWSQFITVISSASIVHNFVSQNKNILGRDMEKQYLKFIYYNTPYELGKLILCYQYFIRNSFYNLEQLIIDLDLKYVYSGQIQKLSAFDDEVKKHLTTYIESLSEKV